MEGGYFGRNFAGKVIVRKINEFEIKTVRDSIKSAIEAVESKVKET